VAIWAAPASQLNTVPVEQRQAAANAFYSDLYKVLSDGDVAVAWHDPHAVRARRCQNPERHGQHRCDLYALRQHRLQSRIARLQQWRRLFRRRGYSRGLRDGSTNGGLLWEAVDKRGGTTALAENTLNTWLDVDHAFQAWADQPATRLQDLGGSAG
jgi:hypothetical protein